MTARHDPSDAACVGGVGGRLVAVVALTPAGVIGKDGGMPWRLSSDLKRFKRMTLGGTLLMGRKTFDSIGRPLPGRRTIVVTRQPAWRHAGVEAAADVDAAVRLGLDHRRSGPVFVVGGAEIYRQLIDRCDELWLTRVWSAVPGDTSLTLSLGQFGLREVMRVPAGSGDSVPTEFHRYRRICETP